MREPNSGQRGLSDEDGEPVEYASRWDAVPAELVHDFVRELCDRHTYRVVAKMVGLAPETVRKYVEGIGTPFRATRKRFAELFLEHHAGGYMARKPLDGSWLFKQKPLRKILPPGPENARAEVEKLFAQARSSPEGLPEWADGVKAWIEEQLAREYAALELGGAAPRRQRRRAPKPDG